MPNPDAVGKSSLDGRAPYTDIFLKVAGARVERATFCTFGCGASIAACSVLTELVRGKPVSECANLSAAEIVAALGGVPEEKEFCVDLAIKALRDALAKLPG